MTKYIIRRLILVPVLLIGVSILIFSLVSLMGPTERVSMYVSEAPKNDRQIEALIRKYGVDQPIYKQYWRWLAGTRDPQTGEMEGGIIRGEFGYSKTASMSVLDLIKNRFPATLELAMYAIIPVVGTGIIFGVISAVYHNKLPDQILRVLSIIGWSFPTFVFGLLVLMYFYADKGWFPPGRVSPWASQEIFNEGFTSYTHLITIDSLINGRIDIFWDAVKHLVLPVVTLAYLSWARMLRLTRSSMLETLRQDYITTGRSKGLSEIKVIVKHGLPNALIPIITIVGFTIVGLLSGVVITETIFNYPGIGRQTAQAAVSLDIITVLGMTLFNGFVLIFMNLVIDLLYGVIDPRVRYD